MTRASTPRYPSRRPATATDLFVWTLRSATCPLATTPREATPPSTTKEPTPTLRSAQAIGSSGRFFSSWKRVDAVSGATSAIENRTAAVVGAATPASTGGHDPGYRTAQVTDVCTTAAPAPRTSNDRGSFDRTPRMPTATSTRTIAGIEIPPTIGVVYGILIDGSEHAMQSRNHTGQNPTLNAKTLVIAMPTKWAMKKPAAVQAPNRASWTCPHVLLPLTDLMIAWQESLSVPFLKPHTVRRDVEDPWFRIARRIRAERQRQGLSARELANLLDCSRTTIHNWEAGRPIPLERCPAIAKALHIDLDEFLALHPHAPTLPDGEMQKPLLPVGRLVLVGLVVMAIVVIGAVTATWLTATADCFEVGAGGGSMLGPFRQAYERYGGEAVLGCATNEVHKWGPAYVQDFDGGAAGRGVLMTLDRVNVFPLAGAMFSSYVDIADGATADLAGAPTADPRYCAGTIVVPLAGGIAGPGALVSVADGGQYVWLPPDIWIAFTNSGGVAGLLGAPLGDAQRTPESESAQFQSGMVVHTYGVGTAVVTERTDHSAGSPLDLASCQPVPITDAALGSFVTADAQP